MALIIVLILQGLHQERLPKRLQLTCHCIDFPESQAGFLTQEVYSLTVSDDSIVQLYSALHVFDTLHNSAMYEYMALQQ